MSFQKFYTAQLNRTACRLRYRYADKRAAIAQQCKMPCCRLIVVASSRRDRSSRSHCQDDCKLIPWVLGATKRLGSGNLARLANRAHSTWLAAVTICHILIQSLIRLIARIIILTSCNFWMHTSKDKLHRKNLWDLWGQSWFLKSCEL